MSAGPLRFEVMIHLRVRANLVAVFGEDVAVNLIRDLLEALPALPIEARQDRDAGEPDVFHHQHITGAFGIWRTLDLAINDGWEADRLHVIDVEVEHGGRVIFPRQLGPLE